MPPSCSRNAIYVLLRIANERATHCRSAVMSLCNTKAWAGTPNVRSFSDRWRESGVGSLCFVPASFLPAAAEMSLWT